MKTVQRTEKGEVTEKSVRDYRARAMTWPAATIMYMQPYVRVNSIIGDDVIKRDYIQMYGRGKRVKNK